MVKINTKRGGEKMILLNLLKAHSDPKFVNSGIINWATPIISFGQISSAIVATVGLNPSNLEFVDQSMNELSGVNRRFHTFSSLGISSWENIEEIQVNKILEMNDNYFKNNPYDTWFKKLDYILGGSKFSYYFPISNACHIDIVPYATILKWNKLGSDDREYLIKKSKDTLALILKESQISFLILNGQSVVDNFEKVSGVKFENHFEPKWDLTRKSGKNVKGKSYVGTISQIGNIDLERNIKVIGYNHNIQSSYGITKEVMDHIKNWVKSQHNNYFNI